MQFELPLRKGDTLTLLRSGMALTVVVDGLAVEIAPDGTPSKVHLSLHARRQEEL
jgi:hypothetical protein